MQRDEYAKTLMRAKRALQKTQAFGQLHVPKALKLLTDIEITGTGAFVATQIALGTQFTAWEPESIWLELDDKGVDLPEINHDKIQAAITLALSPQFYWDAALFENTCLAFSATPVIIDAIQEATPSELSWGVYDAEILSQHFGYHTEFDYEPAKYAALSLHRAGLVVAPELLVFSQPDLDHFTRDSSAKDEALTRWLEIRTNDTPLESLELKETPVDVQIARLAAIQLFTDERLQRLNDELSSLGL